MEITDDNKIYDGDGEDYSFKYNFINTPWDDRSMKNKIGLISLFILISAVTTACVANNLTIQYRGFKPGQFAKSPDSSCHFVKKEDYRYVARIYSVSTKVLLCVGAVIGPSSVLANAVCVKSGPIRLQVGGYGNPRCKKGFAVDESRTSELEHEGAMATKLLIIESFERLATCSSVIKIGLEPDWNVSAYIIGRPPVSNKRSLTKQLVNFDKGSNCSLVGLAQKLNKKMVICVRGVGRCPVRAGDLLLQNHHLFGIASTSQQHSEVYRTTYFANLSFIHKKVKARLQQLDL